MLPENEAKTKWCPMARNVTTTDNAAAATNRDNGEPDPWSRCLGSGCMMWRWKLQAHYANAGAHVSGFSPSTTEGYCGLAGMPSVPAGQ